MATSTNRTPRPDGGEVGGRDGRTAPPRSPRPRKNVFDKEHATLWLLTLSLGLGAGAVIRVAQTNTATAAAAPLAPLATQQAQLPGYGATGSSTYNTNQRVMVLPQRTFQARGTTRMS
jgi:hypothetical protein